MDSRVSVFVSEGDCKKLPPNVARQVVSVPVPGEWRQVRLDRWALQQVEAPEYPQNRFRLAVALSVLEAAKIDRCQIVVESAADATGRRSRTLLRGRRELADFLGRFWCHAKSRRSAVRQAGPPDG